MTGFLRSSTWSRALGPALAVVMGLSMVPAATSPASAAAFFFTNQTCGTMDGRSGSENDANPATYNEYEYTVTLQPGQSFTVAFSSLALGALVNLLVNGTSVLTSPGGSYTISYSSAAPIVVTIFVHEASFAITSSCGGPTPSPLTNAELAAATRDALTQSLSGARPDSSPNALPASGEGDACAALRREVAALEAAIGRQKSEIDDLEDRKDVLELDLGEVDINQFELVDRIRAIDRAIGVALDLLESLEEQLVEAERALGACEARVAGEGEDGELGDDDEVLFFPRPDSHVPWPIIASYGGTPAHAYAGNSLDLGSDRFFDLDGMPANFWTRVRGNVLDGTFGRTGFAGSLQAGLTVGITDDVDLGVYAYLLTGRISSTPLSGELKTLAAALGAYVKKHLDNGITLGLSGSQEFGSNDITLSGATGNFTSSLSTLDASVSFAPIRLDGFVLTPSAAAGWEHTVNGGYTDSTGLAVPSTSNTTLAVTGALGVAYPMAVDHTHIATVTPRASVAGSLFLLPGSSLALTPGTLSPNRFTLDVSAGVSLGLVSGGTVDVVVTANGLLGQSQAYGVRASLLAPI